MKSMSVALLLMASIAFVLLGCSDNSSSLVTPISPDNKSPSSPGSLSKSNAEDHLATGSAHFSFLDGGVKYNDLWTFNAKTHEGKTSGQLLVKDFEMGYTVQGEIYQLKVDGKMAKLAFTAKRGPTYPGWETLNYGFVVVIDNGEGVNASGGDEVSMGVLVDENGFTYMPPYKTLSEMQEMGALEFLNWLVDLGISPHKFVYADGNIQVR